MSMSLFEGVPVDDVAGALAGLERRRFAAGSTVLSEATTQVSSTSSSRAPPTSSSPTATAPNTTWPVWGRGRRSERCRCSLDSPPQGQCAPGPIYRWWS